MKCQPAAGVAKMLKRLSLQFCLLKILQSLHWTMFFLLINPPYELLKFNVHQLWFGSDSSKQLQQMARLNHLNYGFKTLEIYRSSAAITLVAVRSWWWFWHEHTTISWRERERGGEGKGRRGPEREGEGEMRDGYTIKTHDTCACAHADTERLQGDFSGACAESFWMVAHIHS